MNIQQNRLDALVKELVALKARVEILERESPLMQITEPPVVKRGPGRPRKTQ